MNDDVDSGSWAPICTSGCYSLVVLTARAATSSGYNVHPKASFLGVVTPDGGEPQAINFLTLSGLKTFLVECTPHSISFRGVADENIDMLGTLLTSEQPTLH